MCERCPADDPAHAAAAPKRRLKLWELKIGLHCSVIGTCLSHGDLMALARRNRLDVPADATTHEVHGFFVGEAAKAGPIGRAIGKMLDHRFEGAVRLAQRCACPAALRAFWLEQRDAGRIAGAYWAVLTAPCLTDELRAEVFGEVHMLSHLQGQATLRLAGTASTLDARVHDLEQRLTREAQRHAAAIAERDDEIARLRRQRCEAVARDMLRPTTPPLVAQRDLRVERRRERALAAARERARTAEAEAAVLRERLQRYDVLLAHTRAATPPRPCPAAETLSKAVEADKRRLLYVGGRTRSIDALHAIARQANAELVHHDGGLEEATARIDGLVAGCDAVFCPIDCVSHAACQRAKALCRKHDKPFVPLRTSGTTTFARALAVLDTQ